MSCTLVFTMMLTMTLVTTWTVVAQNHTSWSPARTTDGQPDIQGTWVTFDSTPFEAPAPGTPPRAGDLVGGVAALPPQWTGHDSPMSQRRRAMVIDPPDGRVPVRKWAEDRRDFDLARVNDHWTHETPWVRCITRGFPAGMFPASYNNAMQIIQIPGYVVIVSEMIHETRVIPLNTPPRLGSQLLLWNGDPRGHWEGHTLVVETTNFIDKVAIATSGATGRMRGVPQSSSMRVVERFTPLDTNTIEYQVTIDDPKVYTQPWTVALPLNRDSKYQMFEYSCHEGNISIVNELKAGRAADAAVP